MIKSMFGTLIGWNWKQTALYLLSPAAAVAILGTIVEHFKIEGLLYYIAIGLLIVAILTAIAKTWYHISQSFSKE